MKKMLSLVFALVMLAAYSMPASAELKIGGDAQVRPRAQFQDVETPFGDDQEDDLKYMWRVRLNASADLGDGYFFKTLIAAERSDGVFSNENNYGNLATVGYANTENHDLEISQFYFGRMMENSHYMAGRMPLNSANNPVFDLTTYPFAPLEIPTYLINFDRVFGFNYGTKVGPGELNATLCILDNESGDDSPMEGDGLFNDGYALHLTYKTNIGDITIDPQLLAVLTNADVFASFFGSAYFPVYNDITPWTIGTNVAIPAGDTKLTLSGFYTACNDNDVEYDGYLFRVKAENGPIKAWIDYSSTNDESFGGDDDYNSMFVWAQYNYKVHESSMGSFTLSPTVRYYTAEIDSDWEYSRLRTELWATVTF